MQADYRLASTYSLMYVCMCVYVWMRCVTGDF